MHAILNKIAGAESLSWLIGTKGTSWVDSLDCQTVGWEGFLPFLACYPAGTANNVMKASIAAMTPKKSF